MPFLAPAIPAIIGAAGTIGGSLLAGRRSPAEQASQQNLLEAQRRQLAAAGTLEQPASQFTGMATQSFQPAIDFWSRILAGNRPEMMSTLAPEVGRISSGYDQAARQVGTFAPAGGGRASLLSSLPFQKARDISTLFSTLRPQAGTVLPQIGATAGGLGVNLYTQMLNALRGVQGGAGTSLDYELARQRQSNAIGQGIGKTIFDIVRMIPIGGRTGSTRSGGAGPGSYPSSTDPYGNWGGG